MQFDWRWIGLVVVIAIIAGSAQLPWPVVALALAGGGGYLVYAGWQKWQRSAGGGGGKRVTYWRGERIELPSSGGRNLPATRGIIPALPYFLIGGALVLAAVGIVVQRL